MTFLDPARALAPACEVGSFVEARLPAARMRAGIRTGPEEPHTDEDIAHHHAVCALIMYRLGPRSVVLPLAREAARLDPALWAELPAVIAGAGREMPEACPVCGGSGGGDEPWLVCRECEGAGVAGGLIIREARAPRAEPMRLELSPTVYDALREALAPYSEEIRERAAEIFRAHSWREDDLP